MLNGMAILLFCQLAGEVIVRLLGWPVPGPVLGMLLLFLWLLLCGRSIHDLDLTADGLLKYLALLFVPAGVGVMVYFDAVGSAWAALLVTLTASAVITLVVTGLTMQWMLRRKREAS
ncbi:MAG: CidA/LrgA family protein [Campylobacterales bacterium]|jgi:holin-like protein